MVSGLALGLTSRMAYRVSILTLSCVGHNGGIRVSLSFRISCSEIVGAAGAPWSGRYGQRFSSIFESPCKLSINSAIPGNKKPASASCQNGLPSL
jgi:hypothetical protein